jgi:outer membrane protein insertion porin family
MDKVVRREADMAGLLPGEVLDLNRIDKFKDRLANTGYFNVDPRGGGKPLEIKVINRRPADKPYGETQIDLNDILSRMQNPDDEPPPIPEGPVIEAPPALPGPGQLTPFGSGSGLFSPPPDTLPPITVPSAPVVPADPPAMGRRGGPPPGRRLPLGTGEPPGTLPSLPFTNRDDVGPDRQEPFANRAPSAYADVMADVDEAATGRLMFGLGASSFGGLNANLILQENNFDLFAIPRSFDDITNGRAFRGAGQQFRLELSPGTLINRYIVSFNDPYLFDLPIGLGTSGYQFTRFYNDWSERRGGGRFSLGRQFGPSAYADVAFRIEDVVINGFRYPAPAELLSVSGHTTLATLRPAIRWDTRNNPFTPSSGSYLEAAFEQGWGSFTYPKFTVEGRKHFETGSRPDGSGKRILTMRGFFGVTGRDTPIYEKFFAGDFRSMRGFYYRGVGPHILDVNIGGVFTSIGSIEYQFPWTANDQFHQVVFCDFGTVEQDFTITNFRAAVGTGVRVLIPQLFKQMPLAFDLAFPIAKGPDDRERYFTFFIGAFW